MRAKIPLISGKEVEFNLPDPDNLPSCYFFSMERSGSSLFWEIVKDLMRVVGRPYCEILEDLFEQGIARAEVDTDKFRALVQRSGYAFGMFRNLDPALQDLDLSANKKFLLVRDPRDVLVSLYFSMAGSHRLPESGSAKDEIMEVRRITSGPIGAFVRSGPANSIHQRYEAYVRFCRAQKSVEVFRYEDVIFDKRGWTSSLIKLLNIKVLPEKATAIADAYDILPTEERPSENVRQVRPGNWRRHLDTDSAAYIEDQFSREMAYFGYVPQVSLPEAFRDMLSEFCSAIAQRLDNTEAQLFDAALDRRRLTQELKTKQ